MFPPAHSAAHPDDRRAIFSECLVEGGDDAVVDVRVRFLQVVRRQVARVTESGLEPVDELQLGGERHLTWDEAVEREVAAPGLRLGALGDARRVPIAFAAGRADEELRDATGGRAGALLRSWERLDGSVEVRAQRLGERLFRLAVTVSNATPWEGRSREDALPHSLCSTHTVVRAEGAELVSLTDPPERLRAAAAACRNEGSWPVLVGEPGERHTVLAAPIILEDYPRVAPESPGDLFDATEIDQLLTLSILSLSEAEREEMRATDPRAREILERTDALSEGELMKLHGAVRELRHVRGPGR